MSATRRARRCKHGASSPSSRYGTSSSSPAPGLTGSANGSNTGQQPPLDPPVVIVRVLDPKRVHNVSISLCQFKHLCGHGSLKTGLRDKREGMGTGMNEGVGRKSTVWTKETTTLTSLTESLQQNHDQYYHHHQKQQRRTQQYLGELIVKAVLGVDERSLPTTCIEALQLVVPTPAEAKKLIAAAESLSTSAACSHAKGDDGGSGNGNDSGGGGGGGATQREQLGETETVMLQLSRLPFVQYKARALLIRFVSFICTANIHLVDTHVPTCTASAHTILFNNTCPCPCPCQCPCQSPCSCPCPCTRTCPRICTRTCPRTCMLENGSQIPPGSLAGTWSVTVLVDNSAGR